MIKQLVFGVGVAAECAHSDEWSDRGCGGEATAAAGDTEEEGTDMRAAGIRFFRHLSVQSEWFE